LELLKYDKYIKVSKINICKAGYDTRGNELMKDIRLGCSGWDYRDWEKLFYKNDDTLKLEEYSQVFNTTEITSTFYSFPSEDMVDGWVNHTPDEFSFSVKLNRLITHEKQLSIERGVEHDVRKFCTHLEPLHDAGKLACILIQLPPGLEFDAELLGEFLGILPKKYRFALESRNNSWVNHAIEARKILEMSGAAPVIVDSPLFPVDISITAGFAYIRWHGRGRKVLYDYSYTKKELTSWEKRIREISGKAEVFGYFNNHYHGFAPENCMELIGMLGLGTEGRAAAAGRMEAGRAILRKDTRVLTLDDFSGAEAVESLLLECMDNARFEKAKQVKDIEILKSGGGIVLADVRGYSIYIDTAKKLIIHDCPDWRRTLREKKLCKHIGGLLLALPEKESREVLGMVKNKEFEFRSYNTGD
jgi:uncharacterized protein YecE (DUF72 family)